ncbi:MAG TPA: hypothetical protein VKB87_16090, partial [Myxococcaceae bacterium]|nr:hypothetical protein [Myxococcaceae bacterium]
MNQAHPKVIARIASAVLVLSSLALSVQARAEDLKVNPDNGNNTFTAIFDAPLGERITAVSSSVSCDIAYDEKSA